MPNALSRLNVLILILFLATACAPEAIHVNADDDVVDPGMLEESGHRFIASGQNLQDFLTGDATGGVYTGPIETDVEYFDYVALQFDAPTTPDVELRVSPDGTSSWSEWMAVNLTFAEEGAHNGFVPVVLPEPYVQVRFVGTERDEFTFLKVEVFDARGSDLEPGQADFDVVDDNDDIRIARLELAANHVVDVTRAEWGARGHSCSRANSPNRIVIHHTGTPTNESTSVAARVRQVQNYSQNTKGFCDMMYHFLIGRDGLIYEGRNELLRGAHAGNANDNSVGIVFIGDFSHHPPSQAMMDAGARLMGALASEYGFELNRNSVEGHRQSSPTACPGSALYHRLEALIDGARDGAGEATTPEGCTTRETDNCAYYGCGCVAGECSGGNCSGSGCTTEEIGACNATGCGCVDGQCSGGACQGSGCTALTESQCGAYGCGCVDGACSGAACGDPTFSAQTRFEPVAPYRANDTRNGSGGRLKAGTTRMFDIHGVPDDAEAVTANITAVNPSQAGFLTVYPCGERPATSSLNYEPGEARPGQITMSLSPLKQLCVYSPAAVDVVIDVAGWWRPSGQMQVEPLTPIRMVDTRAGDLQGRVAAGQTRELNLSGLVSPSASAISMNVTAVNPSGHGYVTVFPCSQPRPWASHLNLLPGVTRANHVTLPLDSSQRVCLYAHQSDLDLLIDLTGTWEASGDQQLTAHAPTRVSDTRGGSAVAADTDIEVHPEADGVVFASLVVVGAEQPGYAAVYSCQDGYRGASTLNFSAGSAMSNAVVVDTSRGGVCARVSTSAHLIFDTFATQR